MSTIGSHTRSDDEISAIHCLHRNADLIENDSNLVNEIIKMTQKKIPYIQCALTLKDKLEIRTQCDNIDRLRAAVGEVVRRNLTSDELETINGQKWSKAGREHGLTDGHQQKMISKRGDHYWEGEQNAELLWLVHDENFQHNSGLQKGLPDLHKIALYFNEELSIDDVDAATIKSQWARMRKNIYKSQNIPMPRKSIDWEGRGLNEKLLALAEQEQFQHQTRPHVGMPNYQLIQKELGDENITIPMLRAQLYLLRRRNSSTRQYQEAE